jgi:hypothetical protein
MIRIIGLLAIVGILTCLGSRTFAQDYKIALGLRLSTPSPTISSSVSGKFFIDDRSAIEGLVSFGTRFGIGGLYERHLQIGGIESLNWFFGGGAYLGFQNSLVYTGPTGIIGIDYKFKDAPVNLSLDWKPELDISPAINFVPDAFALSARFVLK